MQQFSEQEEHRNVKHETNAMHGLNIQSKHNRMRQRREDFWEYCVS